MSKYTDEQLAGLTDEEREAILSDDGQPEIGEIDEDMGDDEEVDQDDEASSQDDEDAGKDAKEDQPAEQEEAKAEHVPLLDGSLPDGLDDRLAQINQAKAALVDQFDDGEISAKEYQQKLDELGQELDEIKEVKFKAKLAAEMESQRYKAEWQAQVGAFLKQYPQYAQNQLRYQTLDQTVRRIAADNPNMQGDEILELAHNEVVSAFGSLDAGKPASTKPSRTNPRDNAPQTLANIPAADLTGMENTRFAALDRIRDNDPLRFEREIAKLSDADREAYLQSA